MRQDLVVLALVFALLLVAVTLLQPPGLVRQSHAQGPVPTPLPTTPTPGPSPTPVPPTSIPALSDWGSLFLVILMGLAAVHFLRKQTAE